MLTCTFAPTGFRGPQLVRGVPAPPAGEMARVQGPDLVQSMLAPVREAEDLGVDYLLVAQRWWGNGEEIEESTYDTLAMTAFYAAHIRRMNLITAIHPGFYLPGAIAKWGATIDRLTAGRWAINVTSGWNLVEFDMYGAAKLAHDQRYARSSEFIEVLRGAWAKRGFSYEGEFYQVEDLQLDPPPVAPALEVFQGGQSEAAIEMAARHSDWMFLNGGPPAKIGPIIERVRRKAGALGRTVRFALYCEPLCRATDAEAQAELEAMLEGLDPDALAKRRKRVGGAEGMWAPSDDRLALLQTNEGYASRLIGSPATLLDRIREFQGIGVDCLTVLLYDERFNREVLPELTGASG